MTISNKESPKKSGDTKSSKKSREKKSQQSEFIPEQNVPNMNPNSYYFTNHSEYCNNGKKPGWHSKKKYRN